MTAAKKAAASPRKAAETSGPRLSDVIFAIPQTTADGVERKGGDRAEIPAAEARLLIRGGRARAADAETPQTADQGTQTSSTGGGSNEEGTQS